MKFGSWMSVIGLLAGVWVILTPYLMGFAPTHGNPWTGIVLGTDILGALVILASLVGLVAFWGLRLGELSNQPAKPRD